MSVTKRVRYEVLRRDEYTCRYCGEAAPDVKLTVDHVNPVSLGGSDDPSNLVAACQDCNAGKSSSQPDAPLVAAVSDGAIQWAAAVVEAADVALADHDALDERCAAFEAHWGGYKDKAGAPYPLDPGWRFSVDRWLAAGLPLPILFDSAEKAMSLDKVADKAKFRYTAGVAWKSLNKIHATALQSLTQPPAPVSTLSPRRDRRGRPWAGWDRIIHMSEHMTLDNTSVAEQEKVIELIELAKACLAVSEEAGKDSSDSRLMVVDAISGLDITFCVDCMPDEAAS